MLLSFLCLEVSIRLLHVVLFPRRMLLPFLCLEISIRLLHVVLSFGRLLSSSFTAALLCNALFLRTRSTTHMAI
jgi:hypothetical protein